MGIVLSPLMYGLLSQLPVYLKKETEEKDKRQQKEQEPERLLSRKPGRE